MLWIIFGGLAILKATGHGKWWLVFLILVCAIDEIVIGR